MTPHFRRLFLIAAAVAALAVSTALLIRGFAHSTVAFGQQCAAGNCWGYLLEQYRVSDRAILTITGSWGMQLEYDLPKIELETVNERWLAGDRAIYLNARLRALDQPAASASPLRLIYDFQRGQLYINSPLQLWRAPDYQSGNPSRNWVTDAEFDGVLARIEP